MSIPRLMSWLDHAIFELTGDVAAGYYLSNNVNAHKPAQAYYANYDHAQLQSIYRQVTSKAFALNAVQPTTTPMSTAATTGSRLATIHRTMPNLVTNIAKSVGKADGVLLDKNIELHNRLVTYIYMMFAFGIGIRSVNDPLESINHLDMATGLMLLNDKENRSVTNCRYVFLPSILKQQIIAYKKHLNALLMAISGCALTLRQKVTAAIKGENNAPMLFFINSERKVVERVTPKKLTGRLKGIWPVPLNMGRHYLRSELGRRGCPAYWIDAMMGHAEIGVEANSKFSAMSFGTLKQLTDEYLEPLVKQGRWQVLKGLGC